MNRLTQVRQVRGLRALLIGLALLSAAAASAFAAEKPKDFAFGVPLTVDAESAFYRAALPAAFYTGSSRADHGDVRVFNGDDAMVPFAFLQAPAATHEQKPPALLAFFPLRVDQEGADVSGFSLTINRTVGRNATVTMTTRDGVPVEGQRVAGYLVDASNVREPITAMVIVWASKPGGMNARIRVETSDDLSQWRTLVGGAPLLDLEYEGRHLLRDRIELQQPPAKYLRISWPPAQAPLPFEGVHAMFGDRVLETPRQWSEATGAAVADKENEYQFDLGGALPVDRVTIELPEINSVVPAQLLGRATPDEPWRPVASVVTYRLRQDAGEISAPPLAIAAVDYRYWLLRVDPKSGGIGRGAPRLRGGWIPQEIVFAARGSGPFLIAYGSATATPSALAVTTLVPGYRNSADADTIPVARTGAATSLGSIDHTKSPREYRRAALWAMLILGVAVLGWMAWQLSRQLNAPPPKPKPEPEARDGAA